ncbi:MAG: hypothetical protein J6X19_05265, partial [Clostridia bacterium]|nr:hypothetical protein [Clostridia bacterium]
MNNRNSGSNIIRGTREVRRGGKAAAAFRVLLFVAAMLAAVLFAGCRVNVNPEIPVVTVFYENTPPATDDPYVVVPET